MGAWPTLRSSLGSGFAAGLGFTGNQNRESRPSPLSCHRSAYDVVEVCLLINTMDDLFTLMMGSSAFLKKSCPLPNGRS